MNLHGAEAYPLNQKNSIGPCDVKTVLLISITKKKERDHKLLPLLVGMYPC